MSLLKRKRRFWPTEELRNADKQLELSGFRARMTLEQINAFDGFMLAIRRELRAWRKAKNSPNYSGASLKKYWAKVRGAEAQKVRG